jgi:hypothetical protein
VRNPGNRRRDLRRGGDVQCSVGRTARFAGTGAQCQADAAAYHQQRRDRCGCWNDPAPTRPTVLAAGCVRVFLGGPTRRSAHGEAPFASRRGRPGAVRSWHSASDVVVERRSPPVKDRDGAGSDTPQAHGFECARRASQCGTAERFHATYQARPFPDHSYV